MSRAIIAILRAPSAVLCPPINPLAWMKIPPGTPVFSLRMSSRKPHHTSGSFLRLANEFGSSGTACIVINCRVVISIMVLWYASAAVGCDRRR